MVGLEGIDGKVTGVQLGNGETLQADMIIVGIGKLKFNLSPRKRSLSGVFPPTDFISGAGIRTDKRGFILVDKNFRVSSKRLYKAIKRKSDRLHF